jgi:hypothetical protein
VQIVQDQITYHDILYDDAQLIIAYSHVTGVGSGRTFSTDDKFHRINVFCVYKRSGKARESQGNVKICGLFPYANCAYPHTFALRMFSDVPSVLQTAITTHRTGFVTCEMHQFELLR